MFYTLEYMQCPSNSQGEHTHTHTHPRGPSFQSDRYIKMQIGQM